MFLGLVCSLLNARHFRSKIDELAVFVPQVLFMLAIFGYLCFAIVYKWLVDWVALGLRPPSLISMLIAFAMSPGTIPADAVLFPGQAVVQLLLFVVALVAVPWMLLAKPLLLKRQHDAAATGYAPLGGKGDDDSAKPKSVMAAAVPSDFDFGEVMMHSVIHTIEYVLGTVSNTASYLRLWALSLAHKQLSVVFYEMILLEQVWVGSQSYYRSRAALPPAISSLFHSFPYIPLPRAQGLARCSPENHPLVNALYIVPAFAVWLCVTVGILCCMELLSAFLHALRLHWVEYMNKFFQGGGRKFQPFSL